MSEEGMVGEKPKTCTREGAGERSSGPPAGAHTVDKRAQPGARARAPLRASSTHTHGRSRRHPR